VVQSGQYFKSPDLHAVARIPHGQAPPLSKGRDFMKRVERIEVQDSG